MNLVDTDVLVDCLRGTIAAKAWLGQLAEQPSAVPAVAAIRRLAQSEALRFVGIASQGTAELRSAPAGGYNHAHIHESEVQMKLEVELRPHIGEALLARARSEGLSLDQFAERALEALVKTETPRAAAQERVKAFEEFLAGLESDAVLPEEAFQRESWYPDRP